MRSLEFIHLLEIRDGGYVRTQSLTYAHALAAAIGSADGVLVSVGPAAEHGWFDIRIRKSDRPKPADQRPLNWSEVARAKR